MSSQEEPPVEIFISERQIEKIKKILKYQLQRDYCNEKKKFFLYYPYKIKLVKIFIREASLEIKPVILPNGSTANGAMVKIIKDKTLNDRPMYQ